MSKRTNFKELLQRNGKVSEKIRRRVLLTNKDIEKERLKLEKNLHIKVSKENAIRNLIHQIEEPIDIHEKNGERLPIIFKENDHGEWKKNGERNRLEFIPTENINESISMKNCTVPFPYQASAQRISMGHSQISNMILPIKTEVPIVSSALMQEIYALSTTIQPVRVKAKIKLLKKFQHHQRRIYIYEYNDEIHFFDTDGTITHNGFSSPLRTDFDLLEEGVEYDLSDSKSNTFYIKYPSQFNPATKLLGIGCNVTCCVNVDVANANDSVKVSETFVRKFAAIRSKEIKIKLINKKIITKFPKIGEIVNQPILLKMIPDGGVISMLAHDENVPSGAEDEIIFAEPNTYISRIEVYCNEPIDDEVLEGYRKETLKFRNEVSSFLSMLPYEKLSSKAKILMEDYRYTDLRTEKEEVLIPRIHIFTHCIDFPKEGFKFSNLYGSKATIQEIYPDGRYLDQYGLPIDIIFPSTSIVNRMVPGLIHDVYLGSISLDIKRHIDCGLLDKKNLYKLISELYSKMNMSIEWEYAKMTEDELWEYAQNNYIKFNVMPYSSDLDIPTSAKVDSEIIQKYMKYHKHDCYYIVNGIARKLTNKHIIGTLYMFRDYHDTYEGNQSCSISEKNVKNTPIDKDPSRRDGRALISKQAVKIDILLTSYLVNLLTHSDAHLLINGKDDRLNVIHEQLYASGISLSYIDKTVNDEILFNSKLRELDESCYIENQEE